MLHRRGTIALAAMVAALTATAPAAAETDTTSVTIQGGSLVYTTPLTAGDFPSVTLNGLTQVVKADIDPYVVTDARGTADGWKLSIAASRFSDGAGHTLPAGSLAMVDVPIPTPGAVVDGVIPPVPSVPVDPIDGGSTQTIASAEAAPLSGTGQWTFTPTAGALVLTIPPDATPGTYSSTITTTLSTGP